MSRVLVTGGAGYIGSHTCKALAEAGHFPITLDNLVHGHRRDVRWGPLEVGDIRDRERLVAIVEQYHPEAVIHFAAFAYVGESVLDPGKYYSNNVSGTLTLLEVMRDLGINRVIFSSTCATYGNPETIPITEEHPQRPINPYGSSKLMVERILADFADAHNLQWIALRYFNAAGTDPDGEIGELHTPEFHLIPLVLQTALGHRAAIQVYGDDYDTPDGTCIRDYIHVTDLAAAHVLALESLGRGCPSQAFNLGNGRGYSVMQVIEQARRVTGREIPVEIVDRRSGDPPVLYADASKAGKLLRWKPAYPDLEAMIEHAWRWQCSQERPTDA